jgi:hypothetical protein
VLYANLHTKQKRFLLCFEACASVTVAARWAKIHRSNHYQWLEECPAYANAFAEAQPRAERTLEDEAVRRAHQGLRRAIRYKGKIVGYETEYSDTLMNTLLKASPKFRDKLDLGGSVTVVKRVIGVPDDAV